MLLAIGFLGYLFFTEFSKDPKMATRWKRAASETVGGETYEFYPLSWLCLSEFDKKFLKCDTESELERLIEEQRKYVLGSPAANELLDESAKLRTRRMLLRLKGGSEGFKEDKLKFIRLSAIGPQLEGLFVPPDRARGDKETGERVLVQGSSLDRGESQGDQNVIWDPAKDEVLLWGDLPWDREKIKNNDERTTSNAKIKVEFIDGSQLEYNIEIVVHPVRQVEHYPFCWGFAAMIVDSGPNFNKMVDDLEKEVDGLPTLETLEGIWNYLAKHGIRYQNHSGGDVLSQRVRHVEEVIESKKGNCVELSVLFASLGVKFGLPMGLYFEPRHCKAFLRGGESDFVIEATMLTDSNNGLPSELFDPDQNNWGYASSDARGAVGVKPFEP